METVRARNLDTPASPGCPENLARVFACSDFVAQSCAADPSLLGDLLNSGDLRTPCTEGRFRTQLDMLMAEVRDEQSLASVLRRFRRREMVRIAWRDLAGWANPPEVLRDLSALAEACIDAALTWLDDWQAADLGVPTGAHNGQRQRLVVIGMGKLGAGELNFSSDIDLIFAYPEEGETRGGRKVAGNAEYFTRLARSLIAALGNLTADGFVFRVDMRLRPFGDSGPLVMNFNEMEDYYQAHGREWERYAWIKANVSGGDRAAGAQLMTRLKPFIYRRYLDYSAFESLREMKALIAEQVRRKDMENNIKLGAGGIREVEFIGQAFQLIRGGRESELQERPILTVLRRLETAGHLPGYVVRELIAAYLFLRRAENRLQAYADQQTHTLPEDEDGRLRLAFSMGFESWPAFEKALDRHRRLVHGHFEQVFEAPQTARAHAGDGLGGVWRGMFDGEQAREEYVRAGFDDPAEAARLVQTLRGAGAVRALSAQGRARLDQLMPLLLAAAGRAPRPVITLQRLLEVIAKIARRTTYLALLAENPMALSQLVRLCAASPWITARLARHPLLLDELLDPRNLYAPAPRAALARELRTALSRLPADDLEQQMETLRHFKQAHALRVAAADVAGVYPLMVVSDHLTEIAEVVLDAVLALARTHLDARHGRPHHRVDGAPRETGFAIAGYGKLGGIELGYGSDLDLVFLHESDGATLGTDGAKPLDNAVYFARLGQRIIHLLSAHTPAGVLYEVDMRLRPSGSSGLLVSGLDAFAGYQRREAWTWEHQALVRARVVAGDEAVAQRFNTIRREILSRERDIETLRREVREMRARMRAELGQKSPEHFDLKQDAGGITDIEFMVQYCVLAWAHKYPELLRYTDNIRILENSAGAGLLPAADAALLASAYRAYRAKVHQLTLQQEPAVVAASDFADYRAQVRRIWRELMEE